MKKIGLLPFAVMAWAVACKSDEFPLADLPSAIKTYIDTNYPGYKMDEAEQETLCAGGTGYEVEIEKGEEEELTLTFDTEGVFLFSTMEITPADLPSTVVNTIAANYPGYTSEEPCKLTMADGSVRYEVDLEKGKTEKEVQIDPEGSVLCELEGD